MITITADDNASDAPILTDDNAREARISRYERLRVALRGQPATLPIGEALHPIALAAVALLVLNDWILKRTVPIASPLHAIVGKLSDLAGLAAAPVILSAVIGLVLLVARTLGARVDPWLTRRRLLVCIAATGAVFAAVKLDPHAATAFARAISWFGRPATVYRDPTDLLCLPMLAVAYAIGRDELRRIAATSPSSPTAARADRP